MNIKVPSQWSEISLKQFEELVDISNDAELTDVERETYIISSLCNLSYNDVMNLDIESYGKILKALEFMNAPVEKKMPDNHVTLNGNEYIIELVPKNFTAAQFLDFKVIANKPELDKHTARMCACFIIPKGHKYNDGYDNELVVNDIYEYMSIEHVLAVTNFFFLQYKACAESLIRYSARQMKKSKLMSKTEKKKLSNELATARRLIQHIGQ